MGLMQSGPQPILRSWMLFVDGENLTIRAQDLAKLPKYNVQLKEDTYYKPDVFIWFPNRMAQYSIRAGVPHIEPFAARATYYTSLAGDFPTIDSVRDSLRMIGFAPQVFKAGGQRYEGLRRSKPTRTPP